MISAATPEQKLDRIAAFLTDRIDSTRMPPDGIADSIVALQQSPSVQTIRTLVEQSNYSSKQFIHLFKKWVGLSPKEYQRVLRFGQALQMIHTEETIEWAALSADCGYYDQAHFIKDFKSFSGFSPRKFLDAKKGRPNFFPVDDETAG